MPAFITEPHMLQIQAVGRMAKGEERPRVWTTMEQLGTEPNGPGPGYSSRWGWHSHYASQSAMWLRYGGDGYNTRTAVDWDTDEDDLNVAEDNLAIHAPDATTTGVEEDP